MFKPIRRTLTPPAFQQNRIVSVDGRGATRSCPGTPRSQAPRANVPSYRLVMIGAPGVGKTALAMRLLMDRFSEAYDPTIEDLYHKLIVLDGESCLIILADTSGNEQYNVLRDEHIVEGDGFLLVFAVNDAQSFRTIRERPLEIARIRNAHGTIPMVMVSTKCDQHISTWTVDEDAVLEMSEQYGMPLIQTSSRDGLAVERAFHTLVREIRKDQAEKARLLSRRTRGWHFVRRWLKLDRFRRKVPSK